MSPPIAKRNQRTSNKRKKAKARKLYPLDRNPRHRPTDYREEFCEIAASLCLNGATDFEVAEQFGVAVSTLYRWKAAHPLFREALKVGKELADDRVEASLYHRANGYSYHAVKIMQHEGVPIFVPYIEHEPPDVSAINTWLTNRRGDKWKMKQSMEHTGKDGGPMQVEDTRASNLALIDGLSKRVTGSTPGETAEGAEGTGDQESNTGSEP